MWFMKEGEKEHTHPPKQKIDVKTNCVVTDIKLFSPFGTPENEMYKVSDGMLPLCVLGNHISK